MTNKQYNKIKTQVDRVERLRQNYEAGKKRLAELMADTLEKKPSEAQRQLDFNSNNPY